MTQGHLGVSPSSRGTFWPRAPCCGATLTSRGSAASRAPSPRARGTAPVPMTQMPLKPADAPPRGGGKVWARTTCFLNRRNRWDRRRPGLSLVLLGPGGGSSPIRAWTPAWGHGGACDGPTGEPMLAAQAHPRGLPSGPHSAQPASCPVSACAPCQAPGWSRCPRDSLHQGSHCHTPPPPRPEKAGFQHASQPSVPLASGPLRVRGGSPWPAPDPCHHQDTPPASALRARPPTHGIHRFTTAPKAL